MTTVIRYRAAVLIGVLLISGLLTGCAKKPGQAGSAAIVGDTVIPLEQIQQRVDAILREDTAARSVQRERKLDVQAREVLSLAVQHELITGAARKEGISVDDKRVDRLLQQAGGPARAAKNAKDTLGISLYDARGIAERVSDELLLGALARKQIGKIAITFDYVLSTTRAEADGYARRLAAEPSQARQVVQDAVRAGRAGELGRKTSAAEDIEDARVTPLFALPANTVATFPAGPQGTQWLTVLMRDRDTNTAPTHNGTAALRQLDSQTLSQIGLHLLIPYAQRRGIEISPRYGEWDPIGVQVVASSAESTGSLLAVRNRGTAQ